MQISNKMMNLIGLAQKAGKIASGEFSVEKSIQMHKAKLVIVADDASDNTKKQFGDKCNFYHIPLFFYGDKQALGHAIGRELRSTIAVNDAGFSNALIKLLQTNGGISLES